MADQILIEFTADTSGLDPAINQLEKLGTIDKASAASFKATNAEYAKREQVLKATGKAAEQSGAQTKKSIDEVDAAVKRLTEDFVKGFDEGVIEALAEAGVSVDQFNAAMAKAGAQVKGASKETAGFSGNIDKLKDRLKNAGKTDAFGKLEKDISSARRAAQNTAAELERLGKTGGEGTERFKQLTDQLVDQKKELADLEKSYEGVAESLKNFDPTDVESLRERLAAITKELQRMKLAGEDATNPEKYAALVKEGGNLRDTLGDVNQELANAASNSSNLDGLIGAAQGLAGAFALGQGLVGVFGDKAKGLDEVLVGVNSSLAILQGLQTINNTLQAESAAVIFANTIRTRALAAAQTLYNVVVGESIGLMRVLKIAFASTGVGLLIIGITALVIAFNRTSKATQALIDQMKSLNDQFAKGVKSVDDYLESMKLLNEEGITFLENSNAIQSDIIKERIRNLQTDFDAVFEFEQGKRAQYELSKKALEEFNRLVQEGNSIVTKDAFKELTEQHKQYVEQFEAQEKKRLQIASDIRRQESDLEKQLLKERLDSQIATTESAILRAREGTAAQLELQKKLVRDKLALELGTQQLTEAQRLQAIAAANQEQLELQAAYNKRLIEIDISRINTSLTSAVAGTRRELELRRELLKKQAAAELTDLNLSGAERMQILEKSAAEQAALEREFAAQLEDERRAQRLQANQDFIQAAISRNATELALIKDNDSEKLRLQLVSLDLQASEERRAAAGNAIEIARINAQTEAQQRDLKRQFIQDAVDYELRLETAKNGRLVRGLQTVAGNERALYTARVDAINQLREIDIDAINQREAALRNQYKQGLISQKEYNLAYAELEDQRVATTEESEKRIKDLTKQRTIEQIQTTVEITSQLIGLLDNLFQAQSDKESQRVKEQQARVDELLESGAITEKEATRRRKQLEIEERQAQQRAAQRDKQIAVFRALLAIPSAFLQGLSQGGPILGAIYAAIAGVQAALVISRPVPKFAKGKKNRYEGFGQVGEAGAELIEKDGQMFIAKKPTVVWLGAEDKVYTARETAEIMDRRGVRVGRVPEVAGVSVNGQQIDYDKMGASIARHQREISLNIDGYKNFVINGHSFDKYLNSRRGY
jgi:hypothetical protein